MDLKSLNGFSLQNIGTFNVILGKNGCGKSYLLKQVEQALQNRDDIGKLRYISPERGGLLNYEPGVEQNIINNPNWLSQQRRKNQSENFRQQSATLFRRLELMVLRETEAIHLRGEKTRHSFDETVSQLNTLLDRVYIERDTQRAFRIRSRADNSVVGAQNISSGESELISLGIEILTFLYESEGGHDNVLLIDEPDVHLHPDLQYRLSEFLTIACSQIDIRIIVATHSTPLLGGLSSNAQTKVCFMQREQRDLYFRDISDVDRTILPIFGAHPLSNVFNQRPILLVEGEDDERVWQQAVRSSQGKVALYPCQVDGTGNFSEFEEEVRQIIAAVYDDAKAFSIRDRDEMGERIEDRGLIVRERLGCRAAENLLLSDDVLKRAGTKWTELQKQVEGWVERQHNHPYHYSVRRFIEGGMERKFHDLKDARNILAGFITNKPWEVLVGQTIADVADQGGPNTEGSLKDFLGRGVCERILEI